jgi:hypothetical protein
MADSRSQAQQAFLALAHLLDDDKGASDEIISNASGVIEDFQRFFVLHFQLLKISGTGGRAPPRRVPPCSGTYNFYCAPGRVFGIGRFHSCDPIERVQNIYKAAIWRV